MDSHRLSHPGRFGTAAASQDEWPATRGPTGRTASTRHRDTIEVSVSPAQLLIQQLCSASIIVEEDWERLTHSARDEILHCPQLGQLLPVLTRHGLLTP